MPKKQHTISNFISGINKSLSPREDSSAIQEMTDLDPVRNIGEISTFRSIKDGILSPMDGALAPEMTKATNLATMSHDFGYAIPESGSYNSTIITTGQGVVTGSPFMTCNPSVNTSYYNTFNNHDSSTILGGMKWTWQLYCNGDWRFLTDPNVNNAETPNATSDSGVTYAGGMMGALTDLVTQANAYDFSIHDGVTTDVTLAYDPSSSDYLTITPDPNTTDQYEYEEFPFQLRTMVFANMFWLNGLGPPLSEYYFAWTDLGAWWSELGINIENTPDFVELGGWDYFGQCGEFGMPHLIQEFSNHYLSDDSQPAIAHKVRCTVVTPISPSDGIEYVTTVDGTDKVLASTGTENTSENMADALCVYLSAQFGSYTVTDEGIVGVSPATFTIEGLADGTQFTIETGVRTPAGVEYDSDEVSTNYIAVADKFGQIHLYDDISNVWHQNIAQIPASYEIAETTLFADKGVIRACDAGFNGSQAPRWIGHIDRKYFGTAQGGIYGNTNHQRSINAWINEPVTIEAIPIKVVSYGTTPTTPTHDHPITLGIDVDTGGSWTNAEGEHKFAISTLYDDSMQESKLVTETSAYDNAVDVGGTNRKVSFKFCLYEQDWDSLPARLRVSGFRIYAQEPDSDTWYLQAEVSMTRGIRAGGETEYSQWEATDYDTNVPECVSVDMLAFQRFESYEVMTGHSLNIAHLSFDDSSSQGWVTATECNSRVYYGNVKMRDAHGKVKELNDAMVRSEINKPDKVSWDNLITVTKRDGESIIALKTVGTKILQFKKKTLHIIDTSSGYEVLSSSEEFMGVGSQRAIADVVGGVAWINRYGLWYYNGSNQGIINLLELKGVPKIPLSEWTAWYTGGFVDLEIDEEGWVSFDPSTQWLYAFKTSKDLGGNGLGFAFNFGTGTLCNVSHNGVLNMSSEDNEVGASTGAYQKSNTVNYKNRTLFGANLVAGGVAQPGGIKFMAFGRANMKDTNSVKLITADMNFGNPISRKKIVRYNISHKSDESNSGLIPLHRENGTGAWQTFNQNDSYDGEYLLFNDNGIANNSFETQGASSTDALNWTLTAHSAGGGDTYRHSTPSAIQGNAVVKVDMGVTAEASGTQAYLEQTSLTANDNTTYILSLWMLFSSPEEIEYITNPPADGGFITISSATGGTGTVQTYYNGWHWQSASATISLSSITGITELYSDDEENLLQGVWAKLSLPIYARSTTSGTDNWGDGNIGDMVIRLTLPDINGGVILIDDFSLTNTLYSGYTVANLIPANVQGDVNGNIYSSQLGLFGSGVRIDNLARINDISVIYRERNVK